MYDNGEIIFRKLLLDDKKFKKYTKQWNSIVMIFEKNFSEYNQLNFRKLSDFELAKRYHNWQTFYSLNFWFIGLIPEVANWGGEQILERELRKKIKKDDDFHHAFERLSSPENFSFYQKEELDLLSLKFIKNKKLLDDGLKKHQQKYFWLLNSYHHSQVLPASYFKKIIISYSLQSANQKVKEIKALCNKSAIDKNKIIRKYDLSKEILKIGKRLAFGVWWQDIRKGYIFRANHVIELFLKEISRRHKMLLSDLHFYLPDEIADILEKNKKVGAGKMKSRKNIFIELFTGEKIEKITGKKALKILKIFTKEKHKTKIKSFKGLVVNRGLVQGRVRVILGTKDLKKMKKGGILVSSMTAPDYITALRKAAAVVTDEGGMTCHAAIVSRELKIPGIVSTKIATKVLKDGDLVEVDANHGVVKIINKFSKK